MWYSSKRSFGVRSKISQRASRFSNFILLVSTNCYYRDNCTFTTNGVPQTFVETYATAITHLNLTDSEFLAGTLGWSEDVWSFDLGKINYPVLKK